MCWRSHGFEYIALDLDPARIRAARQVGDPVIFGDSADEEMLMRAGLERASAVIISFADPGTSIGILRSIRALRREVPVLVRTAGRFAPQRAARSRRDRRGARDARSQPDARLAGADAAERAGHEGRAHREATSVTRATRCSGTS